MNDTPYFLIGCIIGYLAAQLIWHLIDYIRARLYVRAHAKALKALLKNLPPMA